MRDWQRLIHSPLAHWAQTKPQALAVDDGLRTRSFAQLHAAVQQRAQQLGDSHTPATRLLDVGQTPGDLLVDFIATNASGRCAALGDAAWPAHQQVQAQRLIDNLWLEKTASADPEMEDCAAFYIGFTSGSTGRPKGFRRHHRSWVQSFQICIDTFGSAAAGRILAPGNLAHSLFLFAALMGLWTGAGVHLQPRFSASQCLAQLRAGATPCLVAVPSQLLVMLQWAERSQHAPIAGVQLILIGAARWLRQHTPALQALFPNARIVEFYGASETSFITWMDASATTPAHVVGRAFPGVQLQIRDARNQPLPAGAVGYIWVHSPMLFMDYVASSAADTSTAERQRLHNGQDWLNVRDMGSLDAHGMLTLVGRDQRMIVTSGKNLFPEEVEAVLCEHPRVAAASVHGVHDALRGKQVWAALQLRSTQHTSATPAGPGAVRLAPLHDAALAAELSAWCRRHLQAYKTPRCWLSSTHWPQTASGKTDHAALAAALQAAATDAGTA